MVEEREHQRVWLLVVGIVLARAIISRPMCFRFEQAVA
jgi:hypothetical protein